MKLNKNLDIDYFPFFRNVKQQIIFIVICCFGLNINTLKNENAFDDDIVIVKNIYVQQGVDGLGKIFSKESFRGYCDYMGAQNVISGGRYRPLSLATFAIEQQLFGETYGQKYLSAQKELTSFYNQNASASKIFEAEEKLKSIEADIISETKNLNTIRHLFQIIFFTLSMIALFWFLILFLFPKNNNIAFLATLLFVFHPVHTEVIANIKSRDEIFSLLFILLTLIFVYSYNTRKSTKTLALVCISFFCALLSKEYALILPFIILAGISISFNQKIVEIIKSKWFIFLMVIDIIFLLMRVNIIGKIKSVDKPNNIFDNPYLLADFQQKTATKIQLLNEYLRLLFFPYKLSYDYSYNHFPYVTFLNWQVLFALIVWVSIIFITIKLWQKKHILSFAFILFLSFFMLINNLLFNIGATMGERLIYHSSVGFCIIISWLIIFMFSRFKFTQQLKIVLLNTFLIIVFLLSGYKTISRNADWKNNFTLFTHDVLVVPNSAVANNNAGIAYINKVISTVGRQTNISRKDSIEMIFYAKVSLPFFDKALYIYPSYTDAYINRAKSYRLMNDWKNAITDWKTVSTIVRFRNQVSAKNANTLLIESNEFFKRKDYINALSLLHDAVIIDEKNVEIWLTLGGVEFLLGNFEEAVNALARAVELNPSSEETKQGLAVAKSLLQLQKKCMNDSMNVNVWMDAAKAYSQNEITPAAISAYKKVLQLSPKNKAAIEGLKKLESK